MVFKIITSLVFITVFIARIVKPEWNIDTTSIILLILAFVPWFIQYIKTLEISGLGKVELVGKEQKKEIDKKASEAGNSGQRAIHFLWIAVQRSQIGFSWFADRN